MTLIDRQVNLYKWLLYRDLLGLIRLAIYLSINHISDIGNKLSNTVDSIMKFVIQLKLNQISILLGLTTECVDVSLCAFFTDPQSVRCCTTHWFSAVWYTTTRSQQSSINSLFTVWAFSYGTSRVKSGLNKKLWAKVWGLLIRIIISVFFATRLAD